MRACKVEKCHNKTPVLEVSLCYYHCEICEIMIEWQQQAMSYLVFLSAWKCQDLTG